MQNGIVSFAFCDVEWGHSQSDTKRVFYMSNYRDETHSLIYRMRDILGKVFTGRVTNILQQNL